MPATAAFCTSSKLARPLTNSTLSDNGVRASRTIAPISLSTALCRPTSSAWQRSRPAPSNNAAACNPPVRANPTWAERSVAGN